MTAPVSTAYQREDVTFASGPGSDRCAAWVYRPTGPPLASADGNATPGKYPAIVLGHGIGGIREYGLDRYAARFSEQGIVCVAFDYRHFGGSTGQPRQLLDISLQQEDWKAAINYTKNLEGVDETRVGIFGSSFGGGHVTYIGSYDPSIKAIIAQCPFTSGFHSSRTVGFLPLFKLAALGIRDLFSTGNNIVPVLLAGEPGSAALMNSPEAMDYRLIVPEERLETDPKYVAARFALHIGFYNPGWRTSYIKSPILFGICGKDSVAPPGPTLKYAKNAPNSTVKLYEEMGHFDIYVGEAFERATADYCDFLRAKL
ncbi:hypothetical protein EX895_006379 [Sporisorium graminicola]|uniref:AB hydrolase-1 domain-containing protein n=1 Tax=Sporisorium graminicola TaxID=280036 RepID=A0A4U7KN69_9BASI|nr:hypothetical protein EX895_006379 [Sporisorium graminicola]TKY84478.1 hypothetical protein EX895_006379 [Sporisorium graminicola]